MMTSSISSAKMNMTRHQSFKGYDARTLDSVVMTISRPEIVQSVKEIGEKTGLKVLFASFDGFTHRAEKILDMESLFSRWAQDYAIMRPDKKILASADKLFRPFGEKLASFFKTEGFAFKKEIHGGNVFYVKNGLEDELLIGANQAHQYAQEELQKIFKASKITVVPQMDFHIDLFLRPLENKTVLICDDSMTLNAMKQMKEKIESCLNSGQCTPSESHSLKSALRQIEYDIKIFAKEFSSNVNPKSYEAAAVLSHGGYKTVNVPGRLYYALQDSPTKSNLLHKMNFMNSIVHKKPNGDLVYITNDTDMDKLLGLSKELSEKLNIGYKRMFIDSLKPFVKEENIHFVDLGKGEKNTLTQGRGGIHCLSLEVPKFE